MAGFLDPMFDPYLRVALADVLADLLDSDKDDD